MTSELQIQSGIRTSLLDIPQYFSDETVQINGDVFLDRAIGNMPGVNLITSNEFDAVQDTTTATGNYEIPAMLYVGFEDWTETYDLFRDVRQAIVDKFNEVGTARSAGGLEGVSINRISSGSNIEPVYYDPEAAQGVPVYLVQAILFEVEIYG